MYTTSVLNWIELNSVASEAWNTIHIVYHWANPPSCSLSGLHNAFQDEMVQGEDKEVVLITLKRPLIYIQPMAVDKAILVWLNYKNAYEYWNEQRSNLNKEVLTATQQV